MWLVCCDKIPVDMKEDTVIAASLRDARLMSRAETMRALGFDDRNRAHRIRFQAVILKLEANGRHSYPLPIAPDWLTRRRSLLYDRAAVLRWWKARHVKIKTSRSAKGRPGRPSAAEGCRRGSA